MVFRVQDLEDLGFVGLGIGQYFFSRQGRPCRLLSGGIADEAREVPDEEGDLMAELLELGHFADEYPVTEVQIRGGGIEARLDAQRPAFLQLGFKLFNLVAGHGPFMSRARASDTDPKAAVIPASWRKNRAGSMRKGLPSGSWVCLGSGCLKTLADVEFLHAPGPLVAGFPDTFKGDVDGPAGAWTPAYAYLSVEVSVDLEAAMLQHIQ